MGNFIMIEEETGVELNPYTLNDSQKATAYKNNTTYICKCCFPQKELKYHFASDLRLIPYYTEFSRQHDEACRKNEDYQKRMAYANPLQQDEDGKLVARVYENLFKRPNRTVAEAGDEHKKRRDTRHTEQQKMRLSALVKKINLEVSHRQACRYTLREDNTDEMKIQLKLEKQFSEEVYGHARDVRISNRSGTVAGCKLDRDGVRFFYNRISKIKIRKCIKEKIIDDSYTTLSYADLIKQKEEHKAKFYCSLEYDGKFVEITYDALRIALQQYENTYNNRILNLENDIIIGAGYQYENGKIYKDNKGNIRKKAK